MVKSKTKTSLQFTWVNGGVRDQLVNVGKYTLYVYRDRHNYWKWEIFIRGNVVLQGRVNGYRSQHTAQCFAEASYQALTK